MGMFQFWVFNS